MLHRDLSDRAFTFQELLSPIAVGRSPLSHGFVVGLQYGGHCEHIYPTLEWTDPERTITRLVV